MNVKHFDEEKYFIRHEWPKYLWKLFMDIAASYISELFVYEYLKLHPNKFADEELEIFERNKRHTPLDIEACRISWIYIVSQKFKDFAGREWLPLDFFPVKVYGERRYMMMWRRLPHISKFEFYTEDGSPPDCLTIDLVFRSDVLQFFGYRIFCTETYVPIFVDDVLRKKMEDEWFLLAYSDMKIQEIPLDRELVSQQIKKNKIKEFEKYGWLIEEEWQELDEHLENILIQEWDEGILEKFRWEVKWDWMKQREEYERLKGEVNL